MVFPSPLKWLLLFTVLVGSSPSGCAGEGYSTPPVGSPVRKEIMDALRVPVGKYFKQPLVFKVSTLRVSEKFALFIGSAQQPNGSPVDYRKTAAYREDPKGMAEEIASGTFFGGVGALLKRGEGGWRMLDVVYDASDVFWVDYDQRFGAPKKMITDPID